MSIGRNNELLAQILAGGSVPAGAADAGNPVKVGGRVVSTYITTLNPGQRSDLLTDQYGRLRVLATDTDKLFGVYLYQTGVHTVLASADTANANRWALYNPGGFAKVRVRKIIFQTQLSTAFVATSAPRIRLGLFTYTPGTFGGTPVAPAKRKNADGAAGAVLNLAATFTGGTLVRGNDIHSWFPCASATAVGYMAPGTSVLEFTFEDLIELGNDEGIILDQPDAGTTSDTRKFLTTILTEEVAF